MFDVAIIGLGAMGSASAYHLARAGASVIGFDRHVPPHHLGSSHGLTRMIREAYFEHPAYVPLLQRAYALWQALEAESGRHLLELTGGLMIGPPTGELVQGCLASARAFGLAHEQLGAAQVQAQYPVFSLPDDFEAVAEPRTGFLVPEACIEAHLDLAREKGFVQHAPVEVRGWTRQVDRYRIQTNAGEYAARKLVLCAGAWLGRLLPGLGLPLLVSAQTLFWFESDQPQAFALGQFPPFLLEAGQGAFLYGFPDSGEGVKVAIHARGPQLDPDRLSEQAFPEADLLALRELLARYLPAANGRLLRHAICMYTNTPDGHFLFDVHPEDPDLLLVSPCSGHGFKFSAVIGEEVAFWAQGQASGHDLSLFALQRPALQTS
ncbi:MAG TPA: N-methyl-L-tryptophan oxidase [Candidatus Obscuribacterales bacterium]